MESDDAIGTLAQCSCGHGIGRHDENGCPGVEASFCVCTLTLSAALDAAIERVRCASIASRSRSAPSEAAGADSYFSDLCAELNGEDYERVGPIRLTDAATIIAMLAPRLIRPQ